jgi:hypothetical protein
MSDKIERKISKASFFALFCFVILIFLIGMMVGDWLASLKSQQLIQNQQKLSLELTGLELKDKLIGQKDICSLTWSDIWQEKVELGTRLNSLELRYGKENQDVLNQKEIYELLEIRTMLLINEINEKCNQSFITIMFFYTNKKNDPFGRWEACEDQGYVLTQLGRELNNTYVFSFDININNPAIDMIRSIYQINSVPTLVIKDQAVSYRTLEELKNITK